MVDGSSSTDVVMFWQLRNLGTPQHLETAADLENLGTSELRNFGTSELRNRRAPAQGVAT